MRGFGFKELLIFWARVLFVTRKSSCSFIFAHIYVSTLYASQFLCNISILFEQSKVVFSVKCTKYCLENINQKIVIFSGSTVTPSSPMLAALENCDNIKAHMQNHITNWASYVNFPANQKFNLIMIYVIQCQSKLDDL